MEEAAEKAAEKRLHAVILVVERPAGCDSAGNLDEEETLMADEKNEGKHHEQETIKPVKGQKDELAEKDLDKASGGGWVELNKF